MISLTLLLLFYHTHEHHLQSTDNLSIIRKHEDRSYFSLKIVTLAEGGNG